MIDVPATIRFRRITLDPKENIPAPSVGIQYGLASPFYADGSPVSGPSVASQPSGKIVNIGRKAAVAYVLNLEPSEAGAAASPAGTPAP